MDYHNMVSASLQPYTASVSLPPISSIEFTPPVMARSSPEVVQPLPPPPPPPLPSQAPPPPRVLPPPMPYNYTGVSRVMPLQPNEYMPQQRILYSGIPSSYHMLPSRVPLPSTTDPNLIVAPARHKTKEVKRRTKTGCLTCRKRRIKCDEGRPECRNCMKSKRHCQGYDPVFQSQGSHSIHPAPSSQASINSSSAAINQARRYNIDNTSPSSSHGTTSLATSSPRDQVEYPFPPPPPPPPPFIPHRVSDPLLPYLNQPYRMDGTLQGGLPAYSTAGRPRHSIEQICTISGTKVPGIPPIPPDSVPNLEPIRKVYEVAFAPGLDKLLETGPSHWFAKHGFSLLVADSALLGLMLAYLTLVSNNKDLPVGDNASLASQEARVTWAMLNLCSRLGNHGGEEADKLARRVRSLEALLTGAPLDNSTSDTITDFVHHDVASEFGSTKGTAFERQMAKRSDDFWRIVEQAAMIQGPDYVDNINGMTVHDQNAVPRVNNVPSNILSSARQLLDGVENRDLLYSLMILRNEDTTTNTAHRHLHNDSHNVNINERDESDSGGSSSNKNQHDEAERQQARIYLESQASGRASNQVFATIAGMVLRAFDP